MIVLSCGHEVADFNHTYDIMCKSSDIDEGELSLEQIAEKIGR